MILIDHPLSPSQERNLEKLTGRRVLDRSGLILDIFAQRARSFEGKLQVELAQLKHLSTRLVRGWTHLERQKGGIGLRGPGETQLETDRRLLATRVRSLTRQAWPAAPAARNRPQRARRRSRCRAWRWWATPTPASPRCSDALTGADAYIADKLFATLDPTVRKLALPGGANIVVADTVGFIRELPHELVAAFQSTLQEARSAHLLLHVIDAADARRDEYTQQVNAVLAEIGAGELPQLLVYNKIDRLGCEPRVERDAHGVVDAGVDQRRARDSAWSCCKSAIAERLELAATRGWLHLPAAGGALRARLYAQGAVREERSEADGAMSLLVELPPAQLAGTRHATHIGFRDNGARNRGLVRNLPNPQGAKSRRGAPRSGGKGGGLCAPLASALVGSPTRTGAVLHCRQRAGLAVLAGKRLLPDRGRRERRAAAFRRFRARTGERGRLAPAVADRNHDDRRPRQAQQRRFPVPHADERRHAAEHHREHHVPLHRRERGSVHGAAIRMRWCANSAKPCCANSSASSRLPD